MKSKQKQTSNAGAETATMSRPAVHFPKWVYIVLPLFMAIIASGLIAGVQRRADDYRSTQLDLARIQGFVYQLHAIEEEAVAEKRFSPELAQTEEQADSRADEALLKLRRDHPNSRLLERVQTAYLVYDAALDVEFPFLRKGDVEGAEKVAGAQVDPGYQNLGRAILQANAHYNQQANVTKRQAEVAITLLMAGGSLFLGIFMWRVADAQRAQLLRQAYRDEEERTQAIVETALDAVIAMDEQGIVVGWNAQAQAIFGWAREEAVGRPFEAMIVPPALRERYRHDLARCIKGEDAQYVGQRVEIEALHRHGHLFPVAMSLCCVRVGGRLSFSAFLSDISERRQAQVRLQQSEERYRSVVDHVKDVIFTADAAANWTFLNPAWTVITGYTAAESLGTNLLAAVCDDDRAYTLTVLDAMRRGQKNHDNYEVRCLCKSGVTRWIEVRLQCALDAEGAVHTFFGTLSDITQRKAAEERLEHQALHDALTGLPNRLLFQDRLRGALARLARLHTGIAVLFVDLDNFKIVNDSMGHEAGDLLLNTVAARLQASARRGDTIARLGGDEFTLLLENVSCVEEAVQTAERIVLALQQPVTLGSRDMFVSASIGIAFSRDEGVQSEDMLRDADTAMYQAKSQGKSGFAVFNASMNADVVERMEVEAGLRCAVERGELQVHYQPLIDLETGCMNGVEALVRWQHPTRGLMAPGTFIPIAEETGLILPIGYWVLEEACRQMQAWKAEYPGYGAFTINVNLSGKQLQRPDVVERVHAVLEKTGIAPNAVKLEITESVMMADVADTVAKLHGLKALGVKLAMDDFGTGYSSMASLNLFPLDTVKIDRAFVKRLSESHESGSIVAAIIMLSKALNLDVTGEGVETLEQVTQLQDLGCHIGQGYYFARPLPADDLGNGIAHGSNHFAQDLQPTPTATVEQYLRAA